jgi:UDPglucose 6-dehydrogenase
MSRVAVIGAGYVGLVTGAGLAEIGHDVVLAERDPARLATLRDGGVPIYEEGLEPLVRKHTEADNLRFEADNRRAVDGAQFVFLTLPTPPGGDGRADVSAVEAVVDEVVPAVESGAILVVKSTVPVGTTTRLRARARALASSVEVVANPEFLREGSAVGDFLAPDRVVVGGASAEAVRAVGALYRSQGVPVVEATAESAEMIKYGSNAYLAARITFVNGLANLCDEVGADIEVVTQAMGLDPRIGPHFLRPGPGYGGSCFPKDTLALVQASDDAGYDFQLLKAVVSADERQRRHIVDRLEALVGGFGGRTVALWGLAFKAHTDDVRVSPALEMAKDIRRRGGRVVAFDPEATAPEGVVDEQSGTALSAAAGADALLIATEWPQFEEIDPAEIAGAMRGDLLYDARNLMDPDRVTAAGLRYVGVGRGDVARATT